MCPSPNPDETGPEHNGSEGPWILPVIPIRAPALFPHSMAALSVGREKSLAALRSMDDRRLIAIFAQRDAAQDDPAPEDIHTVGCLGVVLRSSDSEDSDPTTTIIVEGTRRIRFVRVIETAPALRAEVEGLNEIVPDRPDAEYSALVRNISDLFQEIASELPGLSGETLTVMHSRKTAPAITDFVASTLPSLTAAVKQQLLETLDVRTRMRLLVLELLKERESLRLRDEIREQVGKGISEAQRQVVLREQLKAIQRELGEFDEDDQDIDLLRKRLDDAQLPVEARKEAERELSRLRLISPASAEYSVSRTYLDWLASLPWQAEEREDINLFHARVILDEDHYDLDKLKERILEYLAVMVLRRSTRGPILCLAGPPGVGKTSVGRSIARALGRKFVRLSLGGIRDEAEIRGHRRTYVGALPGQIIRGLRRAGTRSPVFMLDEIDKLGTDFRGDPASALLEVLDPEQNATFRDHYLDLAFDLSEVLFVTTANLLDPIPHPLRDRMEVLEIPGYVEEEKLHIARDHLLPRLAENHGLSVPEQIDLDDGALRKIIRRYTHEAGVRELERKLAAVFRKQAKKTVEEGPQHARVSEQSLASLLGAPRYAAEEDIGRRTTRPGVAVALAWTPYGGEILFVEAARVPRDKGDFQITGQVQAVMQESARTALTWLKSNCHSYGISSEAFQDSEVHIHVPAGAVPKDGPSAGIVMATALTSLFTGRRVASTVALTGEITLSGHLLPVGGIKEKALAAKRSGIQTVILPEDNRADVAEDIPASLRSDLNFYFANTIAEAIGQALRPLEEPLHSGPAEPSHPIQ